MLVAAVLAPEDAEHAELDFVRLTVHATHDLVVFVVGQREFGQGLRGDAHDGSESKWKWLMD